MVPDQISKLDLIQARIDVIPSDWQLCKVAKALNIRNNLRKPISQEVRETIKGDYPYYGPTKVQGYISKYEQDGTYALIGEDGDHFLKYATMPQTQYISGKCTVNNHAHILESSEICDAQWFFNYFKHRDITNFLSRQGAGRFKLNKATLEKLPMLVPPLQEQRKIAKILSTWDKAIATTEKLIEASKQQKKSLMQQLLTGKKRLVNPETGKAFEGEWEEVKVNALITKHSEKTVENKQYPVLTSSRKGIFFQSDYYNDRDVASEDTTGYNVVPRDYFTYRHMSDDLVFKFNRNTICDKGIVSTLYPVFSAKEEVVVPYLLQAILNEGSAFKRFSLSQKQGGSRTYMYLSKLNELTIQIPSITEQQKIASVLTAADQEIEVLEAKLAHFKQEKKALMQQLLTGKRRVNVE
ncbi:restriction endonuclease subunit S [Vibrio sp. 10N.261.49.A12]|uniref:restriction endonuclease subunit S n=1 Tax=Vibrio sp. 10N.261.49.A12 TaxID=3229667 RepID=UPI00354B2277